MSLATASAAAALAVLAAPLPCPSGAVPADAVAELRDGALERALDVVSAESICADVAFLADDELAGRDTPGDELRIAARYLRARLQRLGWRPGARDGFLYRYALVRAPLDLAHTYLSVRAGDGATRRLAFGTEYLFDPRGAGDASADGAVVFCGTGTAEDTAGLALAGRWALCFDSDLPWRERRDHVRAAGAIGLLLAAAPGSEAPPFREQHGRWFERARAGRLRLAGVEVEPVFPIAYLERGAAELLLGPEASAPAPGAELAARVRDERRVASAVQRAEAENVCGFWPGSDARLAREVLVVTAHYDHVGVDASGAIYNGADDNASGTSALLGVAEGLAAHGPLRRSVLLLWVSGEEKGLLGSEAWARAPFLPDGGRAVACINVDMVGRNDPAELLVTPSAALPQHNGLVRLFERLAPSEGFARIGECDVYWERSDHASLSKHLGIPVAFLFAGVHADYHKPTDTADKIDCDKVRRVARLVLRMLAGLQADELGA